MNKKKCEEPTEIEKLEDNSSSFLPEKNSARRREKILKKAFLRDVPKQKMWNGTPAMPKTMAKKQYKKYLPISEKIRRLKAKEKRNYLKLVPATLALVALGYLVSNNIHAWRINNLPPSSDPFTSDKVFDDNGNDLEWQDGQIVFDKMTKEEKTLLLKKFSELVLKDANSRIYDESKAISRIKDILSVSLLPCNLNDETNELDKYYLSILFQADNDDLFSLNYLTGKDFESRAETSKEYFIDFINFLNYECALDTCSTMSDAAQRILTKTEGALFVGEAYWGFRPSGAECYFVPVYSKNGGIAYYAPSTPIDSYEQDPLDVLEKQLDTNQDEPFEELSFTPSENLQKVLSILHNQLLSTKSTEKQDPGLEK